MTPSRQERSMRAYGGRSAEERVAERRDRLLDAALELYGTRGFAATGVKDVCAEAGLTSRYYYESFRDGADLFSAVADRAIAELLEVVAAGLAQAPPDPRAQARAAIGAFVHALAEDPRKARVLFVETAAAGSEAEQRMRAALRRFSSLVAQTARPHVPETVPDRMLEVGALSLVGAIERVMIEWQEGHLDASVDELVGVLLGIFLGAGLAAGVAPG